MTLKILRSIGQISGRMCPHWLAYFFLDYTRVLCFWEEDQRVPFSPHHIKCTSANMTHHWWCWPWSPGQGSACQVSLLWSHSFPALFILYSLVGNHSAQLTSTEWRVMLSLLESRESTLIIWNSFAWETCLFFPKYLSDHWKVMNTYFIF